MQPDNPLRAFPIGSVARPRRLPLPAVALCLLVAAGLALGGCGGGRKTVCIEADGATACVQTEARAVYEVLEAAGLSVGERDRIEPGYWAPVQSGMTVRIVRVEQRLEQQKQMLPYHRRAVPSLGLRPGERRLLQSGQEGEEELSYIVTVEDGAEVERKLVARAITTPPRDEIVAVGTEAIIGDVELAGTLVYLAQGNAWVMRGRSAAGRPLTVSGDLDGRVFALSTDGKRLLFTRRLAPAEPGLNSLWLALTDVVTAEPMDLGIADVLAGAWAPDGATIAYSTGEKTEGSPGWRARNDVWLLDVAGDAEARRLREPVCPGPYCWWGLEPAWLPDGEALVLTDAAALSVLTPEGRERLIAEYAPLRTRAEWVWVPRPAPAPDGRSVALAWHRDDGAGVPEDSPHFDLAEVDLERGEVLLLAQDVGMWARPAYSPAVEEAPVGLAYAVADDPEASANSRYSLWLMDRGGGRPQRIYPEEGEPGGSVLDFAWSPDGTRLAIVADGDLYLYSPADGAVTPLAQGVNAERVLWAG